MRLNKSEFKQPFSIDMLNTKCTVHTFSEISSNEFNTYTFYCDLL